MSLLNTALELGVLHIGHGRLEVNSLTVEQMTSRFPELFKGIGKLKNYQAKLHVNPEVRPVAQTVRRIPFGLRDKVEAEIQSLLQQDIIEPVQGPTSWVSPVVVVPKGTGVRLVWTCARRMKPS